MEGSPSNTSGFPAFPNTPSFCTTPLFPRSEFKSARSAVPPPNSRVRNRLFTANYSNSPTTSRVSPRFDILRGIISSGSSNAPSPSPKHKRLMKEVKEYKSQISELSDKVLEFSQQKREMEKEQEEIRQREHSLRFELEQKSNLLSVTEETSDRLTIELAEEQKKSSNLGKELQELKYHHQKAMKQITERYDEITSLTAKIEDSERREKEQGRTIIDLRDENLQLSDNVAELKKQLRKAEETVAELRSTLQQKEREMEESEKSMRMRLKEKEDEMGEVLRQEAELRGNVHSDLRNKQEDLDKLMAELVEEKRQREKAVEEQKAATLLLRDMETCKKAQAAALLEKERLIGQKTTEIADFNGQVAQLTFALEGKDADLADLQTKIQTLETQLSSSESKEKLLLAEIEATRLALMETESKLASRVEAEEKQKAEAAEKGGELAAKDLSCVDLMARLDLVQAERNELQVKLEEAERTLALLEERLKEREEVQEDDKGDLPTLPAELEGLLRKKNTEYEEKNAELESEVSRLSMQLKSHTREMNNVLSDLNKEKKETEKLRELNDDLRARLQRTEDELKAHLNGCTRGKTPLEKARQSDDGRASDEEWKRMNQEQAATRFDRPHSFNTHGMAPPDEPTTFYNRSCGGKHVELDMMTEPPQDNSEASRRSLSTVSGGQAVKVKKEEESEWWEKKTGILEEENEEEVENQENQDTTFMPTKGVAFTVGASPSLSSRCRLDALRARNKVVPPHLRSTNAAETNNYSPRYSESQLRDGTTPPARTPSTVSATPLAPSTRINLSTPSTSSTTSSIRNAKSKISQSVSRLMTRKKQ